MAAVEASKIAASGVASLSRVTFRLVTSFATLLFISLLLCFSVSVFFGLTYLRFSKSSTLNAFFYKTKEKLTWWWEGVIINLSYM